MSLNLIPLKTSRILDRKMALNQERDGSMFNSRWGGADNNSYGVFSAPPSNTGVSVVIGVPSRSTVVSRRVMKRCVVDFVVNGTNTSGADTLLFDGLHAPRYAPISAVTASEQVSLNGLMITSTNPNHVNQYIRKFKNDIIEDQREATFPSMMDGDYKYYDGLFKARNPLSNNGNGVEPTRGEYDGYQVLSQTPTQAVIRLTVWEPLLFSPFLESDVGAGLTSLGSFTYSCVFSDLTRMLSISQFQGEGNNVTSVSANLVSFDIACNFMSPSPLNQISNGFAYNLYNVVPRTQDVASFVAGETRQVAFNSILLSSVPSRMYIFATRFRPTSQTVFTTDTLMALDMADTSPLSITFDNRSHLTSTPSSTLYYMARENGLDDSYNQWSKNSIICLNFGSQLAVSSDVGSGSAGQYSLNFSIRLTNKSNETVTPTLYCVVVEEGTLTLRDGNYTANYGVLSREDIITAPTLVDVPHKRGREKDVWGGRIDWGAIWGRVKQFVKDNKLISKGIDALGTVVPEISHYTAPASSMVSRLGYGVTGGGMKTVNKNKINLSDFS